VSRPGSLDFGLDRCLVTRTQASSIVTAGTLRSERARYSHASGGSFSAPLAWCRWRHQSVQPQDLRRGAWRTRNAVPRQFGPLLAAIRIGAQQPHMHQRLGAAGGRSQGPAREPRQRQGLPCSVQLRPEASRELGNDAVAEHVGHREYLRVHPVVGRDVAAPVGPMSCHRLCRGSV
jgi:hypothetical protein